MTSRRWLQEEGEECERRRMQEEVASEDHPKRSLRRLERTITPSHRVRGILSYSHRDYDVLFSTIRIPEIAAWPPYFVLLRMGLGPVLLSRMPTESLETCGRTTVPRRM
jgi:hypothetical protein